MREKIDFDTIVDRKGTFCTQWDYVADRFGQADLLPFTVSDTDFAVPKEILETLQQRISHPVFGYTRWNHRAFKESIQTWYHTRFDYQLISDWIIYSPSVIYSISKLIELKSDIGEQIVVQTPAYDAFFKMIEAQNRTLIETKLLYQNNQYTIDFSDLKTKLKHPDCRIFLLCSPHNPTGRVWTKEELTQIIYLCEKYEVFLISDEIHMDILRNGQQHSPIFKYAENQNNLALCTSASKTFNTPGLVASYLMIPDSTLRERFLLLLKNRDGLSSTSILGMLSTVTAYNQCGYWLNQLNDYIDQNVQLTENFIQEYLPELTVVASEATYLLWIDCSTLPFSMKEIQKSLVQQGKVAIMTGATYGEAGEAFLRLNIGCSKEKLLEGLQRLRKSIVFLKTS
ncbi:cystathione beta-lyase [Enterococcus sp. DIV0840]|uniref:MalY/PatB family protein n=1 Tax=unclassified Enterococcus TaxID=2608891 RepID=UPI001A906A49|nr:MalY/PatB family protein [Enterococcus sp. DIV0849a]MBO0434867.1 pyridoxal phosphate-dependent aminotransferase [Enterococcus sp. DIV0849a]